MMFIKIMVIFLQKKTPYKSKHHSITFLQIFQTKKILSSSDYIDRKSAVGQNKQNFLVCFSRFTSNKICYKTWSKQPFCRKFNNIFRFSGYPIAKNFDFNRNNTYVIVHFCFFLIRLSFLVKANFPRQTETITLLLFIHKHGAFSFCSHPIFSLT